MNLPDPPHIGWFILAGCVFGVFLILLMRESEKKSAEAGRAQQRIVDENAQGLADWQARVERRLQALENPDD